MIVHSHHILFPFFAVGIFKLFDHLFREEGTIFGGPKSQYTGDEILLDVLATPFHVLKWLTKRRSPPATRLTRRGEVPPVYEQSPPPAPPPPSIDDWKRQRDILIDEIRKMNLPPDEEAIAIDHTQMDFARRVENSR